MGISFSLNKINEYIDENKPVQARAYSLLLPFSELIESINYLVQTITTLPQAIFKLPLSFYSFTKDSSYSTDDSWHKILPGLTEVGKTALKAALCFINIVVAPFLNLISPSGGIRYHKECGLFVSRSVLAKEKRKTFADITGMEDLKNQLQEVVNSWKEGDQSFIDYGIPRTNGVIFYGPPGTGKTLAAECLAGELDLPFLKFTPAELSSIYVNQSAIKISNLFNLLKKSGGGILFIDEIESLVPKRSETSLEGSSKESAKVISELLVQLEHASENNILVIAATNHLGNIDAAIQRDGRFDLKIEIGLPDLSAREALLKFYLSKCKKLDQVSERFYKLTAKKLENYSASQIKTFCIDCAKKARSDHKSLLNERHILEVLKARKLIDNEPLNLLLNNYQL